MTKEEADKQGYELITCPTCNGEGEVQQTDIDYDECRRCSGKGKIYAKIRKEEGK
jgi:DnaJ-class molecular chaperone